VVAFSESGEIIARSYREYPLYYPQTGWIEIDAEEVYRAVENSLQEVSQDLQNDPPRSLAISSQGEAVVPVGEEGECLAHSIVTFDQRGDEFVPFWERKIGRKRFFELTGTSLSGIGTVNKILWWKKYKQDVFEKARYFLCFEDFIMHRLGVEPAISFSLAGRTMMFEVRKEKWSEEILSLAGIDRYA
jgi:xylulokinase